jgi:hypothetical protein
MARKPNSTRKAAGRPKRGTVLPAEPSELAPQSPALVGRGQGEGVSAGSAPAVVGQGQGRVEVPTHRRPSALLDTRVIYCGDCLDQLKRLPAACIDLIYLDPPFNSNRNYAVRRARNIRARAEASGLPSHFADRHASTAAYIDFMRPRCVELARVLKKTGSFYCHCDWHVSHYVKVIQRRRPLSASMPEHDCGKCYRAVICRWPRTRVVPSVTAGSVDGPARG